MQFSFEASPIILFPVFVRRASSLLWYILTRAAWSIIRCRYLPTYLPSYISPIWVCTILWEAGGLWPNHITGPLSSQLLPYVPSIYILLAFVWVVLGCSQLCGCGRQIMVFIGSATRYCKLWYMQQSIDSYMKVWTRNGIAGTIFCSFSSKSEICSN